MLCRWVLRGHIRSGYGHGVCISKPSCLLEGEMGWVGGGGVERKTTVKSIRRDRKGETNRQTDRDRERNMDTDTDDLFI